MTAQIFLLLKHFSMHIRQVFVLDRKHDLVNGYNKKTFNASENILSISLNFRHSSRQEKKGWVYSTCTLGSTMYYDWKRVHSFPIHLGVKWEFQRESWLPFQAIECTNLYVATMINIKEECNAWPQRPTTTTSNHNMKNAWKSKTNNLVLRHATLVLFFERTWLAFKMNISVIVRGQLLSPKWRGWYMRPSAGGRGRELWEGLTSYR
jgi:hypothetical protein